MHHYLDQVFAVAETQGIDPSDLTETILHRAFCLDEAKWGGELATSVDQVKEDYAHLKAIEERQYTGAKYQQDFDILEIKRQVKEEIKNLRVKASVRTKRWPTILSIDIKSYSGQVGGHLLDGQGKLTAGLPTARRHRGDRQSLQLRPQRPLERPHQQQLFPAHYRAGPSGPAQELPQRGAEMNYEMKKVKLGYWMLTAEEGGLALAAFWFGEERNAVRALKKARPLSDDLDALKYLCEAAFLDCQEDQEEDD
jgi:hypothetical protein